MTTVSRTPVAGPVDARTASLLALIDGDPIHADDRRKVVEAIQQVAADFGGIVSPNHLRVLLTDRRGNSTVYPNVIGAVVRTLAARGVLTFDGWVVTTGSRSGNTGRPARRYRFHGGAA
jgi:uncharacterized alpha-E superfamily protein